MCIFHKWSKWSLPESKKITETVRFPLSAIPFEDSLTKVVQHRVCEKCGVFEEKFLLTKG